MGKHTVKICDECQQLVAYKDNVLFGGWNIITPFVETKKWYNGAEFEFGEAFPIATKKPYYICEKCLNKDKKTFAETIAGFQALQMFKNVEMKAKDACKRDMLAWTAQKAESEVDNG